MFGSYRRWRAEVRCSQRKAGGEPRRISFKRGFDATALSFERLEPRTLLAGTPIITEFLASNSQGLRDGDGRASDWIEIQNIGDAPLNLAGFYLTDDQNDLTRWQFPNKSINPGEFLVVFASSQSTQNYVDAGGNLHTNFALGADGEYVALVAADGFTVLSEFGASGADYPAQYPDISYGLAADGSTIGYFLTPTPGAANPDEALANPNRQIVVSEIMYHAAGTSDLNDFLEIYNAGSESIDLAGWRFDDGVDFIFPASVIAPGEFLVVAADIASFQSNYPGNSAAIVGGWGGHLSNNGERIRLIDQLGRTVDSVEYADEGDWSIRMQGPLDHGHHGWVWLDGHDGGGKSLELINASVSNDYGQNWTASLTTGGTPGAMNSVASSDLAPLIVDAVHAPAIPRSSDPVTVRARLLDELTTGLQATLHWRVDGAPSFNSIALIDFGTTGDERAGDGIYSAIIPPQPSGSVVEFYLQAGDQLNHTRTWPAPTASSGQVANLLYQVDDAFDPNAAWNAASDPIVRLIMTEAERAELADIGDLEKTPANEQDSDAQMNGTFIYRDGTSLDVRYNVGIRNRGHGTRDNQPSNYRVNLPSDRAWKGVTAININSQYTTLQVLGSAIFSRAGIVAPHTNPIQVRVNGVNLASAGNVMYGKYAFLEVADGTYLDNHVAPDADGNLYSARRINASVQANFAYLGTDPNAYRNVYFKQTNGSQDDWSDLIRLTNVLNNAPQATYLTEVSQVVDVEQWLRFLALDALLLNGETSLGNGMGDDYDMYRGVNDPRFNLVAHDLDTILGKGDTIPPINRDIFLPRQVAGLSRFLNDPQVVRMYYDAFRDLIANVFNLATLSPLFHQYLDGWAPPSEITQLEQFVTNRTNAVLAQIPAITPTQLPSGTLTANLTLDTARGPWLVTGDIVVPAGVTLTIQPGVTVFFAAGAGIDVAGRIVAEGTPSKRITLTRQTGVTAEWDGIQLNNSQQDNRLAFIDMSFGGGRGHSIGSTNSRLTIDNATWSGTQQTIIEVQNPALRVSNSVFPGINGGETIHGTAPQGTQFLILEGNTFGINSGGDDVIDIGPAEGPEPPVQIRRNIFLGGGDDGIDLDGVDAIVEDNVFMNFHKNTTRDTSSNAVSTGYPTGSSTNLSDIVLRRNIFLNNDHHVLLKEGGFAISEHNVYFGASLAAVQFTEVVNAGAKDPSRGGTFSGDIFWQNADMFTNERPGVTMVVDQSLVAAEGLPFGFGNLVGDPLFVDAANRDFHLLSASPAVGTGPTGTDMGAYPHPPQGVIINELLASNVQAYNLGGSHPDLVELYNRGHAAVDLAGMSMTDDPAVPAKFVFPAGTTIAPGAYLTLRADAAIGGPELHLGFALDKDGEALYLFASPAAGGQLVDSVAFGLQIDDLSIGRVGQDLHWSLTQPTIGAANVAQTTGDPTKLRINEWLAAEDVKFDDDFVELYNPESLPVALHGLFISDDPGARPLRHPFAPLSFIAANGYRALTADENALGGGNHLGFRLTSAAGQIALFQGSGLPLAGDYNHNGAVDAADYVVWRQSASQTVVPGTSADGNGNGWIDAEDYNLWRANFGRSAEVPPARTDAAAPYWSIPSLRIVDFVTYAPQTIDVSQGRLPNGLGPFAFFATPTPGAANTAAVGSAQAEVLTASSGNAAAVDSALGNLEVSYASRVANWRSRHIPPERRTDPLLLTALHEDSESVDRKRGSSLAQHDIADKALAAWPELPSLDSALEKRGANR